MKKLIVILISLLCVGLFVQEQREKYVTGNKKVWLSQFPIASSGPFKGLLTGYWWVKAQNLQVEFKFDEVEKLTKKICYLQPHNPKVWEYLSWNMSFNLMAESLHDRKLMVKWLLEGVEQLEKGLTYNEEDSLLEYALGFTVFMKTRGDYDFSLELEDFLNEKPIDYAKQRMIDSEVVEKGEYIMGLQAVNVFLSASDSALAIASCHRLIKRFPEHEENMLKNIEFIKSLVKK